MYCASHILCTHVHQKYTYIIRLNIFDHVLSEMLLLLLISLLDNIIHNLYNIHSFIHSRSFGV